MPRLAIPLISIALIGYSVWGISRVSAPVPAPRTQLAGDLASPDRWCDLADEYAEAGQDREARACFQRALQLAPHIPQIWIRAANFHVMKSEPDQVLELTTRVLATVPDYDAVIFGYYDNLEIKPESVILSQWTSPRPALSYFDHLLATTQLPAAQNAWNLLIKLGFADDAAAARLLSALIAHGQYETAFSEWTRYLGPRGGDYPRSNRLFNGGFENEPTGAAFDWSLTKHPAVEVSRDRGIHRTGASALRLGFQGTENVAYRHATQLAYLPPGRYLLRAAIRTEGITTNEGVHLHVTGNRLDLRSEPLNGTHEWTRVELPFDVPGGTPLVAVSVCRDPSQKFDNKIAGTAWVDDVSVVSR
jgi:tetratricopeptide (TPR) repeat protein